MAETVGEYINADEIKRATLCTDYEAAVRAESLREDMIRQGKDFTFETVLSTDRNLLLLKKAKEQGYFIRAVYVLTSSADINVMRVNARKELGGHGVPEEKIRQRYDRALKLIPELISVCDIFHLYDNTSTPFRIFKKRKNIYYKWSNQFWTDEEINKLTGITEYADDLFDLINKGKI